MSIVNKLTLRHLKENKGRTVITTLGIIVSVAMITAVFVAIASMLNLFGELNLLTNGNYHASAYVNSTQLEKLYNDSRIEVVGIGYDTDDCSYIIDETGSNKHGIGSFYSGDKAHLEQMVTGEYEGVLPAKDNEIAVEEDFINKNNLGWKIGSTVELTTGTRYFNDEKEGGVIPVTSGSFGLGEKFDVKGKQEFIITAILHTNPATAKRYSILRGFDFKSEALADGSSVNAYIKLKSVNYKSLDLLNEMFKEYGIEIYTINKDYLDTKLAFVEGGTMATTIVPLGAIILAVIMVASVVLIYNAFAMSISERVRYLGMLSSVGATRKQKKLSVYYEGFILGIIGIPAGILAGIVGIGITLKAVGKQLISTGMILGISDSDMNMNVVVPVWAIAGIVLFSALTIFISSFVPSIKASAITPVDAIRQRQEIKVKPKSLKTPRLVRFVFGYEGELAHKNLKRNGRKSRVITVSIALSMILFLVCNYFCSSFSRMMDLEAEVPYQITAGVCYADKDLFESRLSELNDVDDYFICSNDYYLLEKLGKKDDAVLHKFQSREVLTSTYRGLFDSTSHLFINYIDDERFNELCSKNGIDYKQYYGGEKARALLLNNISHEKGGARVFNEKALGKELCQNVVVGDFIDYDDSTYICSLNSCGVISAYLPFSEYINVICKNDSSADIFVSYGIVTDYHTEVSEEIFTIFDEGGFNHEKTFKNDYVDSLQAMETIVWVLKVFIYGFTALITLITIANIVNTISTGIAMRKKEFAMLKSVGTTQKGFNKMIMLESAFYGMRAIVFALPISIGISYYINCVIASNTIPFELNIPLYLAVTAAVFAIVGVSMLFSVNSLRNDSIIETLKTEIN